MTTEQALAKILKLCKNNGTTLDELLKLPVLDAEGKIPAADSAPTMHAHDGTRSGLTPVCVTTV